MPITYFVCKYFMIIVGLVALLKYQSLTAPLKMFEWYIIYSVGVAELEDIVTKYFHIQNLWMFHFTTFIDLLMVLFVFYLWRTSKINGALLQWSFVVYVIFWLIGKVTFEPFSRSAHYSVVVAQCIQIGFSVWLLIVVLQENTLSWKNDPRFWVSSGIILYNTLTLFLFGLFDVMLDKSPSILKLLWHLNWFAIIISYSLFLRAFFCKPITPSRVLASNNLINL